ncbi:hypothetical protein [Bifidobacterium vespertilionis]|uniref:Uncharacterized protein n=1 Tax=Bifidobacterium vespertilionis TaxID=2562524 RepID=A0A5J5DS88_9BIFI|nr:hypothetical protein [Bifidobacterium vespertilionis]KAA8815724.1 hypothetical protein EMO90_11830 [Bifidobacterium vespertilionis]KAA8821026.1 hypothetical protein EM848_11590 [Bifidobacterium vespertilionis]
MKKPTNNRLDMTVYRHENHADDGTRDIMDAQDNRNRGDGETVSKVMTTFLMESDLKEQMRSHCRDKGLKIGDFINRAIRDALEQR